MKIGGMHRFDSEYFVSLSLSIPVPPCCLTSSPYHLRTLAPKLLFLFYPPLQRNLFPLQPIPHCNLFIPHCNQFSTATNFPLQPISHCKLFPTATYLPVPNYRTAKYPTVAHLPPSIPHCNISHSPPPKV